MRLHSRVIFARLVCGAFLGAIAALVVADEPKRKEQGKIDALLQLVETSEGLVFIRNGLEWPREAAIYHMRNKLKSAGDKIQTADEFIEQCATKSNKTGEVYQIKTADGKTVPSADWLRQELKKLNR